MLISYKDNMIFFHVPKVAGTSIVKFFESNNHVYKDRQPQTLLNFNPHIIVTDRHITLSEYSDLIGCDDYGRQIFREFFKFAFVRNPWDKVVSMYFWHTQNYTLNSIFIKKYPTFDDWVRSLYTNFKNEIDDYNIRPQHIYTHIGGEQAVDFIGRFENITEDFKYVCDMLNESNVHKSLPTKNVTVHNPYQSYYTDETKNMIAEIFSDDINLFQYNYEELSC